MVFRPMLASDAVEKTIRYPKIMMPKIDGARGLFHERFSARSLKNFDNKHTQKRFSDPMYSGLDGELVLGSPTAENVCTETSSALRTHAGEPDINWHVFDYIGLSMLEAPYVNRLEAAAGIVEERVLSARNTGLKLVPWRLVKSHDEMLAWEEDLLELNYEGVILRDPMAPYKCGRSTAREQGLLRIKRFVEEDAIILGFEEAQENKNAAVVNELGLSKRSTHAGNMVGKGVVGTILAVTVKDNTEIRVGPGTLTHAARAEIFADQEKYIGKRFKYKHFPRGVKNKPRFPTFADWRADFDR